MSPTLPRLGVALVLAMSLADFTGIHVAAQGARPAAPPAARLKMTPKAAAPSAEMQSLDTPASDVTTPEDYVIGSDDVLSVIFWRDKDMSADVVVRPDGKITLPLLNDIVAAGLTPTQLREKLTIEAGRFLEEPAATVVVKQINSRKVFITGEIGKPGPYQLTTPLTVIQLIALAGGLGEFARREDIVIMRMDHGRALTFGFDYAAVTKRRQLEQNILLKPGDTVVVP